MYKIRCFWKRYSTSEKLFSLFRISIDTTWRLKSLVSSTALLTLPHKAFLFPSNYTCSGRHGQVLLFQLVNKSLLWVSCHIASAAGSKWLRQKQKIVSTCKGPREGSPGCVLWGRSDPSSRGQQPHCYAQNNAPLLYITTGFYSSTCFYSH